MPIAGFRALQARIASTRKVKDALTQLFHARAKQAVGQLRSVSKAFAEELESRPDPYHTCGQLASLYLVGNSERGDGKLRNVLEGISWDMKDASESLGRRIYEMDVRRQKPGDLHWAFYSYHADYQLLLAGTKRLAALLEVDLSADSRFVQWQRLDDDFTSKLRDVLAMPEMADLRDMLEAEGWTRRRPALAPVRARARWRRAGRGFPGSPASADDAARASRRRRFRARR